MLRSLATLGESDDDPEDEHVAAPKHRSKPSPVVARPSDQRTLIVSRASLTDRLAARALALAIQPEVGSTDSAAALGRLAGTDHDALHRALQRIERRHVDRPNPVADAAAQALRLALNTATPTQSSGIPPEVDISWIRREP